MLLFYYIINYMCDNKYFSNKKKNIMIMKQKFLMLALALLALTTSCDEKNEVITPQPQQTNIQFNAKITRATEYQFEAGDEISVFAAYKNSTDVGEYAKNVKYSFANNLFTTSKELVYPESGDDL